MSEHHLKTWPDFFQPIIDGLKTFEIRVNDRDFRPGDTLILEEFEPTTKKYTGRVTSRKIGFMLAGGQFGLPANTVIMSLLDAADLQAAREDAERLAVALRSVRIDNHYECEDGWYSCPKIEGYYGDEDPTRCYCGKDRNNQIIDAALAQHEAKGNQ